MAEQTYLYFNDISIGRKFKTSEDITYQKISNEEAKPILNKGRSITPSGKVTPAFYNSKIRLIEVR